jgi:hypothetical protein
MLSIASAMLSYFGRQPNVAWRARACHTWNDDASLHFETTNAENIIVEASTPQQHPHPVSIEVNKKSVTLASADTTGLKIKESAIAQGVNIQLSFKLFLIKGNEQIPVPNDEPLKVHEHEHFRAVAPDDNS